MNKRILSLLTALSVLVPSGAALAQAVSNTDLNLNQNQNENSSGAFSSGGDARNLNINEGETRIVDSDSSNLVLYPIPPLTLQNIDQMIQSRLGTVNCAVEDQGGVEFRIGFPPAIVIKDQNLDGQGCMEAFNTMAKYIQVDIISNVKKYVRTLSDLSPEMQRLVQEDLTRQILDLFIAEREAMEQKARTSTIEKIKTEIEQREEYREDTKDRFNRILDQNRQ